MDVIEEIQIAFKLIHGWILENITGLLSIMFIILLWKLGTRSFNRPIPFYTKRNRILFLTAHPDDEVLFFGPTIATLVQHYKKNNIYLLCLSSGNHEGLGNKRINELWDCCNVLGMSSSNITLLKYDELKDGPDTSWSSELILRILYAHITCYSIDTIITFDSGGVSGHQNHSACYIATSKLLAQPQHPPYLRVFVLDSISIFRKYIFSWLDIWISYYSSSHYIYVASYKKHWNIMKGSFRHKSQMKWFRILYLIFSRYIFINTLVELKTKQTNSSN